jgi:predicted amidohydrolase YtcJ
MPEERVTAMQALRAYTLGSAYQAFDDDAGRLCAGQRADLCVLGADITAMAGLEISEVPVEETWVSGRAVHRRAYGESARQ